MRRIQAFLLIVGLACVSVWSSGCGNTKTVLIPSGEPVQLAEPVRARIYANVNGEMISTDSKVEIPEGWYCLPDPGIE